MLPHRLPEGVTSASASELGEKCSEALFSEPFAARGGVSASVSELGRGGLEQKVRKLRSLLFYLSLPLDLSSSAPLALRL